MKSARFIGIVLFAIFFFSSKSGICFDDCFDYAYPRQDLVKDKDGLEVVQEFKKVKEGLSLKKRWPAIDLQLTPDEEMKRFGTTGLEQAQKGYLIYHFDGTQLRMMVYMKIVRRMGERKIMGWRAEKNPTMPKEYLDPAFPEEKKQGIDFYWLVHWVDPPDIRGTGYLAYGYNDKKRDQDTWLWFPSLRKTRRLTPAMGADSCGGSYKTMSEVLLRRITDEMHQIVGETTVQAGILPMDIFDSLHVLRKFGPLSREYNIFIRKVAQPRKCWVVRSKSVRGGYCDYYHTRVWLIDKEWGYAPVIEEMYSDAGKLFAAHFHPWRRASSYDGKVAYGWYTWAEDLNFPEEGCSYWAAPQTNLGYDNPQEWFTLRELKRSVPTVSIPYMAVLPPEKLLPPEDLFPEKKLQDAYRKYFPQRVETLPGGNPEDPIGVEKWR